MDEGILFDVENNEFWHASWGERPADDDGEALVARAKAGLAAAPRLVRVHANCYMGSGGGDAEGQPVFSFEQADVACEGRDLASFLTNEFGIEAAARGAGVEGEEELQRAGTKAAPAARVPFWSSVAEASEAELQRFGAQESAEPPAAPLQ